MISVRTALQIWSRLEELLASGPDICTKTNTQTNSLWQAEAPASLIFNHSWFNRYGRHKDLSWPRLPCGEDLFISEAEVNVSFTANHKYTLCHFRCGYRSFTATTVLLCSSFLSVFTTYHPINSSECASRDQYSLKTDQWHFIYTDIVCLTPWYRHNHQSRF